MSVEVRRLIRAAALLGLIASAEAEPADPFDDPLLTRPPRLSEPLRLPGVASALTCPAGFEPGGDLTLGAAIDLALCRDPQVQAAWAAIKQQAAAVGEAQAAYLPTLSLSTSQLDNHTRNPGSGFPDTTSRGETVHAALNWRILDFGGRGANRAAADRLLEAALLSHDAALQKTLASVVGRYADVQTAQAALNSRRDIAQLAAQTVEATLRRESRGAAALNDSLQAKTALARARLAEQRALGELGKASAALLAALNLPLATPMTLAQIDEAPVATTQRALADWLADTEVRHPAIRAARAQWEASREKITVARSEGLPTLDWTGNFYRNGYPNQGLQSARSDTTTWGVTLSIPLFEGFARHYRIRSAEAVAEQSAAQLADVTRGVLAEVARSHADATAALDNLAASEELLTAATQALASSQRRYEKGASDILELLNQQSALADASQERQRCVTEWWSARLRLVASAGALGREDLGQGRRQ